MPVILLLTPNQHFILYQIESSCVSPICVYNKTKIVIIDICLICIVVM